MNMRFRQLQCLQVNQFVIKDRQFNKVTHVVPQRGRNHGFDPPLRKLPIKSLLAHHISKAHFESWVETFGTSSFHLKNFEKF